MFFKLVEIDLPINFSQENLKQILDKKLNLKNYTFSIEKKSLDARNKRKIHWHLIIKIFSEEINGEPLEEEKSFEIPKLPKNKQGKKILVVGSGPAGFFAGFVLQKAGFDVTILERGEEVFKREKSISQFEKTQKFNPLGNYAFGEGGAGTFSDGKLTSRTKKISLEKKFIFQQYVEAGAPKEIMFLTHPHLGSDNLTKIVANLRKKFEKIGGKILFETELINIHKKQNHITYAEIKSGTVDYTTIKADHFIFATGHSAFDTYRMLMKNGIQFKTKGFALGFRVEHKQELINLSQWGVKTLSGIKAAEYRLTAKTNNSSVYSFCMCPGGKIVPATAFKNSNIVNGMSNFSRGGEFGNSAVVTSLKPDLLNDNNPVSPEQSLDLIEKMEQKIFEISKSYNAPANKIEDFLNKKISKSLSKTSFPFPIFPFDFREIFSKEIILNLEEGLKNFSNKLKYFKQGNLIGLETKTSSSIQVLREKNGKVQGFENAWFCGEGSGFAGGIISSAADGIKIAKNIIEN